MQLSYHREARDEVIAEARYYEARATGLGADFLSAVDAAILRISESPDGMPIVEDDVRRCPVPRFPFDVYFFIINDEIRILAIVHERRKPGYWKHRR